MRAHRLWAVEAAIGVRALEAAKAYREAMAGFAQMRTMDKYNLWGAYFQGVATRCQPGLEIVLTNYVNGGPDDNDVVAALLAKGALNGVHFHADDFDDVAERSEQRLQAGGDHLAGHAHFSRETSREKSVNRPRAAWKP